MTILDSLFGVSKRKLHSAVLEEVRFDEKGIRGRLLSVPYLFDPDHPDRRIQSSDFAVDLAEALTNFVPPSEKRLYDSLSEGRDYVVDLNITKECRMRVEFHVDRSGDASELLSELLTVIDHALQHSGVTFVALRR